MTDENKPVEPQWTYGHCKEKASPGGCALHNLHCGYPDCDRRPVEPQVDEEVATAARRLRRLADMNRDEYGAKYDLRTADIIERQQAEIARLTKDRDEFAELVVEYGAMHSPEGMEILAKDRDKWFDRAIAAEAENADLRARLAKAVEALEPFAKMADAVDAGVFRCGDNALESVRLGDLRRARTALDAIKEDRA